MSQSDDFKESFEEESKPSLRRAALFVLGTVLLLSLAITLDIVRSRPPKQEAAPVVVMETEGTEPVHVIGEATVCSTGDLLMHTPIYADEYLAECYENGEYDFSSIFKYLQNDLLRCDYAAANLETTFFGEEKPFEGYPSFNTPPQLAPALKDAGFDLLLTANNHSNDTGTEGILRTIQVVRDRNIQTLGTNLSEEEDKYQIAEINGIKIGMLCYTYEDSEDPQTISLNGNPLDAKARNLVCTFPLYGGEAAKEPFYAQLSSQLEEMRRKGAEVLVLYLHWGEEYRIHPTDAQREMAQRLCDLGVDLIIGSHSHMVGPVEMLTSTEHAGHKTVCVYSLGNAVSNQRLGSIDSLKTAHTEDGVLFYYTFQKYSDGRVRLSGVDATPTWVNLFGNETGRREYNILPLRNDCRERWQELYDLSGTSLDAAWKSYDRTMNALGKGLGEINIYLKQQRNREESELSSQ